VDGDTRYTSGFYLTAESAVEGLLIGEETQGTKGSPCSVGSELLCGRQLSKGAVAGQLGIGSNLTVAEAHGAVRSGPGFACCIVPIVSLGPRFVARDGQKRQAR
jgi:hypothetical protein